MFLKLTAIAAVAMSLNVAQATSLDTVKIFDGMSVQCLNTQDLGKVGYILKDVQVSEQNEGDFVLSMNLFDITCKKDGEAAKWAELDRSPYGTHRVVALDGKEYDVTNNSEILAYTAEYKSFSTSIGGAKNVAIDVRLVDVLSAEQRDSLNRSGEVVVPVFLAKRSFIEYKDLAGRIVSQNYFVGGAYKVLVSVTQQEGRTSVQVLK